jgi:hypothetical protein
VEKAGHIIRQDMAVMMQNYAKVAVKVIQQTGLMYMNI